MMVVSVVAPVAAVRRIIGARCRLHLVRVLADARRTVETGAAVQGLPTGGEVLVPAVPRLQRRILERPASYHVILDGGSRQHEHFMTRTVPIAMCSARYSRREA